MKSILSQIGDRGRSALGRLGSLETRRDRSAAAGFAVASGARITGFLQQEGIDCVELSSSAATIASISDLVPCDTLLAGYNQLENGSFDSKLDGWILRDEEHAGSTRLGVDIASEWQLSGGHSAYIVQGPPDAPVLPAAVEYVDPTEPDGLPVAAGLEYWFSGFLAAHRCTGALAIEWIGESGTPAGESRALCNGRGIGGTSLDDYDLVEVRARAPQGSNRARIVLHKTPTVEGDDSYLFFTGMSFGQSPDERPVSANALPRYSSVMLYHLRMQDPRRLAAFDFEVPEELQDGEPHVLTLTAGKTGKQLEGSPLEFRWTRGSPRWRAASPGGRLGAKVGRLGDRLTPHGSEGAVPGRRGWRAGQGQGLRASWAVREAKAVAELGLAEDQAALLTLLFSPPDYRSEDASLASLSDEEAFDHFLREGLERNLSPGPFVDMRFCEETFGEREAVDEEETSSSRGSQPEPSTLPAAFLLHWLNAGASEAGDLSLLFDSHYYANSNPDVQAAGLDPLMHFLCFGQCESRSPCESMRSIMPLVDAIAGESLTPFNELFALFPTQERREIAKVELWTRAREIFDVDFYTAQFEEGVEFRDEEEAFAHLFATGLALGCRPSLFFNADWYSRSICRALDRASEDPSSPQAEAVAAGSLYGLANGAHAFCHWLTVGWRNRLNPTPLYDEGYYLEQNRDLKRWSRWLFEHFLKHGCREIQRSASPYFSPHSYRKQKPELTSPIHMQDFVLEGDVLGHRPAPDLDIASLPQCANPRLATRLEDAAMLLERKLEVLEEPEVVELVRKATAIDPMVPRPYGRRRFHYPPMKHQALPTVERAEKARKATPYPSADTVVLIPHCRMSGAARGAGTLVRGLRAVRPQDRLLLVMTDLSEFERADWFPDDVDFLDLAAQLTETDQPALRQEVLLDLLRGVRPERVVVVNSRLGWDLFRDYGSQLSRWTELYAYLFCWDLDERGHQGGYPIQWFQACFDSLSGVLMDNTVLMDELVSRYSMPKRMRERVLTAHPPADIVELDCSESFEYHRSRSRKLRALWTGRFDRQKRFDIVVEIAERMPELEIWAWGKVVLGGTDVDFDALPANIRMEEPFDDLDELPLELFDFFLLTSEWEGLPRALIDMGARAMPTLAAQVGGVRDILTEETGYPVLDALNPDAYIEQIGVMLSDPEEVTRRAKEFRRVTLERCSQESYQEQLRLLLGRDSVPGTPQSSGSSRSVGWEVAPSGRAKSTPGDGADISLVLVAHHEGILAGISLRSLLEAADRANREGITTEVLIVLDRANDATRAVFDDAALHGWCVEETDFGDQGKVRNHAIGLTSGAYIAFLDGDDLWSENWLVSAYDLCRQDPGRIIAHPEFDWFFQGNNNLLAHIDQTSPHFDPSFLRIANYWDALCLAPRAAYEAHLFADRDIDGGFAFEDWQWNCETFESGFVHRVAERTIHFKRRRPGSQTLKSSARKALMRPTALCDYAYYDSEGVASRG